MVRPGRGARPAGRGAGVPPRRAGALRAGPHQRQAAGVHADQPGGREEAARPGPDRHR